MGSCKHDPKLTMETLLSIIAGLGVLRLTFKTFFDGLDDLWECVKFWFTPDLFSALKGQLEHDWWSELKLFVWLALGALTGYVVYQFLLS